MDGSGRVERTFVMVNWPSMMETKSVKVPPTSTPRMDARVMGGLLYVISDLLGLRRLMIARAAFPRRMAAALSVLT